jgi:hypothetical protein
MVDRRLPREAVTPRAPHYCSVGGTSTGFGEYVSIHCSRVSCAGASMTYFRSRPSQTADGATYPKQFKLRRPLSAAR